MDAHETQQLYQRFVTLLERLTHAGIAQWAQCHEAGFILCRLPQDLVLFEVLGGDGSTPVRPDGDVGGISVMFRNVSYLFLLELDPGRALLDLLKKAPHDDDQFYSFRRETRDLPVQVLEDLEQQAGSAT